MSQAIAISRSVPQKQSSARTGIINKAAHKIKEPFNDYEKSLNLIDKHNLPAVYGVMGTDVTHGAASHYDKNIKLKNAYTPTTVLKRGLQRAAIGASIGTVAALTNDKLSDDDKLKNIGKSAAIAAAVGATAGPALMYGTGKLAEHIRNKIKNKKDQNATR